MSKKDIKKKVLQYYLSQQHNSYRKKESLLLFLQSLIMNHTKKISFALLVVAFSIFSFASPTDAAWKQKVKDITNKTVYIVKTILWDFTVQELWGWYFAELKNGSWDFSMGIVTVWSIWTWKDQSTWWIASFIDEIQSQAQMNKEILDYLKAHQDDKNQKQVEKWFSSIIQKYNKKEAWERIITGGFAKAVLWSSIINTWEILSWQFQITTGTLIQWSTINVKDLQLIEIKK